LELISLGGGESQDLAGGIIGKKLAAIGDLSAFRMQYTNEFPLTKGDGSPIHAPETVDPKSLVVEIYNESGATPIATFRGDAGTVTYTLVGNRGFGGYAVVKREALKDIVKPGQKVVIKWKVKSRRDAGA
jgi:hypothetical protein